MRRAVLVVGLLLVGCGSAPPKAPPPPPPAEEEAPEPPEPTPVEAAPVAPGGHPLSTASYEEALSTPESLDAGDHRAHLSDNQLSGPMRGATVGCRVPSNAKVTIKTAVQNGRAIGVTVLVRFEHPKPPPTKRRPTAAELKWQRAQEKAENKARAKIIACVDKNVRTTTWPPSSRRDSFTTEI